MKLIIVRHGESEENSSGILQGLLPGKLSEIGKQQSEKLGHRLSSEKIDQIYCSPVARCQETLEYLKKYLDPHIPNITSVLIQERDFGQLSGKPSSEIDYNELDKDNEENRKLSVESLEQVKQRTLEFLNMLKTSHPNETVLVVSHSNPLRMLVGEVLNMTFQEVLEKIKIKNASLSIFEIGQISTPIVINQTDFLN